MAFTAGSPEQAKALKLASQLSALYQTFGAGFSGASAALVVEDYAQKLGFGITGLTTGAGFPPFGTILPSLGLGVAAALQNPRGETMASGITLGAVRGTTVGIYMHKFVRSGEDYRAVIAGGVTLARSFSSGAVGISANGPYNVNRNDRLVFGSDVLIVGGTTAGAAAGASGNILLLSAATFSAATGDGFNVESIGVTRGTSGIAGSTFESFRSGTVVNGGFTACVFFGGAAGSAGTIS
jgi:hypothetical protein